MKRLLKLLALLYPTQWRKRYGAEYDALLDDGRPRVRDAADVLWGAAKAQMASAAFVRVVLPAVLLGLGIGLASSYQSPKFTSVATFRVISEPSSGACGPQQDLPLGLQGPSRQACEDPTYGTEAIERAWTQNAFDQPFLISLIQEMNLYPAERSTTSLDKLAERMQRDIHIVPRKPGLTMQLFELKFSYQNPQIAQQVTAKLRAHAFDPKRIKNWPPPPSSPRWHEISVGWDTSPSLPSRPAGPGRIEFLLAGLFGGLLCGLTGLIVINLLGARRVA